MQIALAVEILVPQSGPVVVDPAAVDVAAQGQHETGMAVIRAGGTVLVGAAAEFGHGDQGDPVHLCTHVRVECRQALGKLGQEVVQGG